jgi:hypothetical protein
MNPKPQPAQWSVIAEMFGLLARIFRDEGRTTLPPFDAMPSAAVDEECDIWCRQNAARIIDASLPPPSIRGWILVRTLCASSVAKHLADHREPSPGPMTTRIIERLMIDEWHGRYRQLWAKVADDSQAFSC